MSGHRLDLWPQMVAARVENIFVIDDLWRNGPTRSVRRQPEILRVERRVGRGSRHEIRHPFGQNGISVERVKGVLEMLGRR